MHGGPVQLQQGQVVVVGLVVVVLVQVDPLNPRHLLRGAAAAQQEFTQVDSPRRGGVEAAGGGGGSVKDKYEDKSGELFQFETSEELM